MREVPPDAVCPGCFVRVETAAPACKACGETLWVGGRLLLVGPLEEGRPRAFRGLLRGEDGDLAEVAVKLLDVGGLPDWREYERFRRQTAILESVTHPGIPRARGDFEVRSRVLHCQTMIPGRSLVRHLRGARLTVEEATRLAEELLEILAHLHGRGVVHRDVTPDNVVLGPGGRAHLVDFGAARRTGAPADREPEPTVVGTPGYMPPEQVRGELRAQSDLYALGKLLVEALGGAKPSGPLAQLIPQLIREDWRRRPESADAALEVLRPPLHVRRGPPRWVAAAVVLAAGGFVVGIAHLRNKHEAAMQAAAPPRPAPAAPLAPRW